MGKLAVIGGDRREEVMVAELAERGYHLRVLSDRQFYTHKNIYYSDKLPEIVRDTGVVIAPMANTDSEGFLSVSFVDQRIKLDENFFKLLKENSLFMIGIAKPKVKKVLEKNNLRYIELARRDDIAILNAIPTAEGALKIAIEETEITIYDSKTLILGLGRVGLTLAWRLKALGADVYVSTRSGRAIARGRDLGFNMVDYTDLTSFLPMMEIIFNTVPVRIITEKYIDKMDGDTVILDLASSPGGVNFNAAEKKGIKARLCPGLPGKIAPHTAGCFLADGISSLVD